MNSRIQTSKKQIRQIVKERMAGMTPAEYHRFNHAIRELFFTLDRVKQASSIMIYHSIHPEAETVSIIQELLDAGKTVSLPVCTPSKDLIPVSVTNLSRLLTTGYGLREPELNTEFIPQFIDLIVLPGLAFDKGGFRLGRGAGYYDRFLQRYQNIFKLGLAYDYQFFPDIPREAHDIAMDGLIKPSGFVEFNKQ